MPLLVAASSLCLLVSAADVAPVRGDPAWRFTKLDLQVAIDPHADRMTVSGSGEMEVIAASATEATLEVGGSWPTMSYVSLTVDDATTIINAVDPARRGVRLGVARFDGERRRGSRAAFRFVLEKQKNLFPIAVDRRAAVALSTAGWYPLPAGHTAARDTLPPGTMTFTLPAGWHVVTNGSLAASSTSGETVTQTYVTGRNRARDFIAAPYAIHRPAQGDGANRLYLLDAPVSAQRLLEAFAKAQAFLTARYGDSPYRSYAIAELPNDLVPWYGASAEGFLILRNAMMQSDEGLLNNLVHELAHSWWGTNLVPSGPGSYLLDEGMASFSGSVFWEAEFGGAAATDILDFGTPSSAPDATTRGYFDLLRAGKDVALSSLRSDRGDDYNIAQSKGVWVLRMLRDRVGDASFFATLRRYLARGEPTLDAFRHSFLELDPGLERFFAQWMDRTGVPILEGHWAPAGDDSRPVARVRILQGHGAPYDLPVDVRLLTRKGVLRRTVRVSGTDTFAELEVPGEVVGMSLDPDRRILMWRAEYGTRPPVVED